MDGVYRYYNVTLTNLTSLPCYTPPDPSQAEVAVYASNVLADGLRSTASFSKLATAIMFTSY
jgi:hypothetical protein